MYVYDGSLASCLDKSVVYEALNFVLSSKVYKQDAVFGLAISKKGCEVAWKWLKNNWDKIWTTYGSRFLLTRFVGPIVSSYASSKKMKEIGTFFGNRTKASMVRTLKQSMEQIYINSKCF
ncbi:hypothetical protein V6Z11_A13G121900 [Gossypium hirsutum]